MIEAEHNSDVFEAIDTHLSNDTPVVFFHGCNARGVMGSGVAKQVKEKWPEAYEGYASVCEDHKPDELTGRNIWWEDGNLQVMNGITQHDYGSDEKAYANPNHIRRCIRNAEFRSCPDDTRFLTVRVGCGLGGLNWLTVRPIFEQSRLPWEVYNL